MIEKPRVLTITNTYPTLERPGDSPQIRDQVEALRMRGAQVDLIYVNRYEGKQSYAKAALKILQLSVQSKQYDLIHAYYGHCGFLARMQAKYPVVVTFLGSDLLHPRDGAIGKIVARFAEGIIVQSEEMKRIAKREDALIIPFGINLHLFTPTSRNDARNELGLSFDQKLVLFPWNPDRPVKRYDLIQEAVRIVQQRYRQVELISIFDQPHEIVAKYMNACDVMVLASDHEGSPMSLREAMACNLPVVSVDVGDVKQIINNIEGCYLCKRDALEIAEKVSLVFEQGKRIDGAHAMRRLDASWGADQVMMLYDRVLNSITRRTKGGL